MRALSVARIERSEMRESHGRAAPGFRHSPSKTGVNALRAQSGLRALIMLAALAICTSTHAQSDWPARPIRLIVPFAAGSSSDIVARIVAQKLGERLKQQIFVDNRVGASGNLGS